MKKILEELAKGLLSIVAMVASLVLFLGVEHLSGFFISDYTVGKIFMQCVVMTVYFAVLWYTRAGVVTTLVTGMCLVCFILAIGSDTMSPVVSLGLLWAVIPIYLRNKEADDEG